MIMILFKTKYNRSSKVTRRGGSAKISFSALFYIQGKIIHRCLSNMIN